MVDEESERPIVRYTAEELDAMVARGESETDWERLRNLTDEEVEASIDVEEEGEFDWDVVYLARGFERIEAIVTFRCDFDLFEWFQRQEDDPERQIRQVLTDYVKEQRDRDER